MGRLQGEPGLRWPWVLPGSHLQDQHGGADRDLREAISEWSGLQVPRNHAECFRYSSKLSIQTSKDLTYVNGLSIGS